MSPEPEDGLDNALTGCRPDRFPDCEGLHPVTPWQNRTTLRSDKLGSFMHHPTDVHLPDVHEHSTLYPRGVEEVLRRIRRAEHERGELLSVPAETRTSAEPRAMTNSGAMTRRGLRRPSRKHAVSPAQALSVDPPSTPDLA